VTADLEITHQNAIALQMVGTHEISIRNIDDESRIRLGEKLINRLLKQYIPKILPKALEALAPIPLPTFSGYGVEVADIWVTGDDSNFIALGGNLIKSDPVEAE